MYWITVYTYITKLTLPEKLYRCALTVRRIHREVCCSLASPPNTICRLFYCQKYIIIVQGLTLFSVIGFKFVDPDVWATSCVWLYISSLRSRLPTYFENEGFPWGGVHADTTAPRNNWIMVVFFRFRQLFFLEEYLKTCFFLKRVTIMFTFLGC